MVRKNYFFCNVSTVLWGQVQYSHCKSNSSSVPGMENCYVTDLVGGHEDYFIAAGDILKRVRYGLPIRRKQGSEPQTNDEDVNYS